MIFYRQARKSITRTYERRLAVAWAMFKADKCLNEKQVTMLVKEENLRVEKFTEETNAYMEDSIAKIAEVKFLSTEEVQAVVTKNIKRLSQVKIIRKNAERVILLNYSSLKKNYNKG